VSAFSHSLSISRSRQNTHTDTWRRFSQNWLLLLPEAAEAAATADDESNDDTLLLVILAPGS
jgi:hypothetical protein